MSLKATFALVLLIACCAVSFADEISKPPPTAVNAGEGTPDAPSNLFDLPTDPSDWAFDAEYGYYWSATAELYFDRVSGHFYDPVSEHWFDPERDTWYQPEAPPAEEGEHGQGSENQGGEGGEEEVPVATHSSNDNNNNAADLWDLPDDHTDWKFAPESGLYWSETAQLYFDRITGHFFDPASNQWYNTEKEVWYSKHSE